MMNHVKKNLVQDVNFGVNMTYENWVKNSLILYEKYKYVIKDYTKELIRKRDEIYPKYTLQRFIDENRNSRK
jgi:hypothetical protein